LRVTGHLLVAEGRSGWLGSLEADLLRVRPKLLTIKVSGCHLVPVILRSTLSPRDWG